MDKLTVDSLGPIRKADVEFGDLTVLVGEQASGKSLLLQLLKYAVDNKSIISQLSGFGYDWSDRSSLLNLYFGKGMESLWKANTVIKYDNKEIDFTAQPVIFVTTEGAVVYIPAQRVLTISEGFPKPFSQYPDLYPFVVREFGNMIHQSFSKEYFKNTQGDVFPREGKLKKAIRDRISEEIFQHFQIVSRTIDNRKHVILHHKNGSGETNIQVGAWSAGQREFFPLLLGLYEVLPSGRTTKMKGKSHVIIEEIEMGLHPRAIIDAMLAVLDIVARGYKVCLSTHSPTVLEMIWAVQAIAGRTDNVSAMYDLFKLSQSQQPPVRKMFEDCLRKKFKVYYMKNADDGMVTKDISSLDPFSDPDIADWGGITEFSTRISDILSNY